MALKTKLLRGLFELDHATNNVEAGQDKARGEQGGERELVYSSFSVEGKEEASGVYFSSSSTSLNSHHNYRQIKINLILKNNLMLFFI